MYDIIVIGGGPGGYSSAIRGAEAGLKVALIERDALGGVCLNWGCIPTKSLLKSSSVFYNATKGDLYGVSVEGVNANITKMVERSRKIASDMSKGIAFLMKKNNIDVICGSAKFSSSDAVVVTKEDNTEELIEGKYFIIATGARPRHFDSIPVDGKNIIDSKGALTIDHIPESMIIVGSGAIGSEFATFFSQVGTKVTLIEYADHIAPLEDAEISSTLERSMRKAGITTLTSTAVKQARVENNKCFVTVDGKKGETVLESEMVLSAVGITSNIENLGLEEIGVGTDRGKILVNDSFETNVRRIYAIGDVIPTVALAHVATKEGETAVDCILGKSPEKIDYRFIPSCIFTSPEVASVGLTEKQAEEEGIEYISGKFSYMASGKASASGMKDGMVKLIFEGSSHRLIGAHLIGADVVEMIGECALAVKTGTTAEMISETVHAHPTMHEAIMEAARAAVSGRV